MADPKDPIADVFNMEPLRTIKSLEEIKAALSIDLDSELQDPNFELPCHEDNDDIPEMRSDIPAIFQALQIDEFSAEMDKFAAETKNASEEIMEHAYAEDPKLFAETAGVSERFKASELEARKAKMNARLKVIDLVLKERQIAIRERAQKNEPLEAEAAVGNLVDRNSILDE